jgi:hypothetical protein
VGYQSWVNHTGFTVRADAAKALTDGRAVLFTISAKFPRWSQRQRQLRTDMPSDGSPDRRLLLLLGSLRPVPAATASSPPVQNLDLDRHAGGPAGSLVLSRTLLQSSSARWCGAVFARLNHRSQPGQQDAFGSTDW